MKFVNIRGTSGSGKSTIIRKLMDTFGEGMHFYAGGRKQPIFTIYEHKSIQVAIMGHYKTACGGCDTINKLDDVFKFAEQAAEHGADVVIAEGLLLGKDVSRIVKQEDPHLIYLTTPIEECFENVSARRAAKALEKYGRMEDVPEAVVEKITTKPKALAGDGKGIKSAVDRLRDKVTVHDCDNNEAVNKVLELIFN